MFTGSWLLINSAGLGLPKKVIVGSCCIVNMSVVTKAVLHLASEALQLQLSSQAAIMAVKQLVSPE